MARAKVFSDTEIAILQRVIVREKRRIINSPPDHVTDRWDAGEDHQAPETYIALPPSGGIPAASGTSASGDDPGDAECEIFQIVVESGLPTLRPVNAIADKTVYNISGTAVDRVWTPITRDKFGKWLAMVGAGGSTEIVFFEIVSADCDTRCGAATVLAKSCGGSQETGGQINIYDAAGCFLTGNQDLLTGKRGYAVKMAGSDPCPGTGTWVGTGTQTSTESGCTWHIISLCCETEVC